VYYYKMDFITLHSDYFYILQLNLTMSKQIILQSKLTFPGQTLSYI